MASAFFMLNPRNGQRCHRKSWPLNMVQMCVCELVAGYRCVRVIRVIRSLTLWSLMSALILPPLPSMELTSLAVNADLNSLVETTPVEFVGGIDARYQCVSCSSTLRQPCQTPCGHRICRSCVDALFAAARGSRQVRCPGNEDDCVSLTRDTVSISANRRACNTGSQHRHCTALLPQSTRNIPLSSVVHRYYIPTVLLLNSTGPCIL